jgi:DNA-binding transcriptional MocR family regulator
VQTYLTPALLSQATAFEFVDRGLLDGNVERVVTLLRERRDAMLETLESEMPEGAPWSRPQGGYFTWLDLPDGTDAAALLEAATAEGVTFVKGRDFYPPGTGGESSARLAYSFVSAGTAAPESPGLRTSSRAARGACGGIAAKQASRRADRHRGRAGSSRSGARSPSRRRSGH